MRCRKKGPIATASLPLTEAKRKRCVLYKTHLLFLFIYSILHFSINKGLDIISNNIDTSDP